MNLWTRRVALVLVGLFTAVSACFGVAYFIMWTQYEDAMHTLEPRLTRIQGILNAQEQIESARVKGEGLLVPWLHQGGAEAQNRVQQQLRQMIDNAGVTPVASQAVLELGTVEKMARARLTATVVGDWAAVVKLLEMLQAQRPLFWVRSAAFMRESGSPTSEPQTVRLTLQLEAPLAGEGGAK